MSSMHAGILSGKPGARVGEDKRDRAEECLQNHLQNCAHCHMQVCGVCVYAHPCMRVHVCAHMHIEGRRCGDFLEAAQTIGILILTIVYRHLQTSLPQDPGQNHSSTEDV